MLVHKLHPFQWMVSCFLVLIGVFYFSALVHVQAFVSLMGDFDAHSTISKANYTYIYILRDFLVRTFSLNPLHALVYILYVAIAINIFAVFFLFSRIKSKPLIAAIATLGMFLFVPFYSLADGDVYVGQLSPNVWHNSTYLIAATPNLALFLYGISALERPATPVSILVLSGLAVLSIGSKPSLFVVLLPAIAAYLVIFNRPRIPRAASLWIPSVIIFVLYYLFILPKDVEAIVAPGLVWDGLSSNILYSILTSTIFFITLAWQYRSSLLKSPEFVISFFAVCVGVVQFYLLAEPGERQTHANYSWGMQQAMTLWLFSSMAFLLRQKWDRRMRRSLWGMLPHLLTGLYYTLHIMTGGSYLD